VSTSSDTDVVKKIDYPGSGNSSQFSYDGLGRNAQIVENTGGTLTSTQQFIWADNNRREERDASGNVTKQLYTVGQVNINSGTANNYFYTLDHLGSARELTDSTVNVVSCRSYDPFGRAMVYSESVGPSIGYGGYYSHVRSNLDLTITRAYNSTLARWMSRDTESPEPNLFAYVENNPTNYTDPSGRFGTWDFVSHYFYGNGTEVNLGDFGLGKAFQHAVRDTIQQWNEKLANKLKARAKSICAGATGIRSLDLPISEYPNPVTNVGSGGGVFNDLFAVGNSGLFRKAQCHLVADCCHHNFRAECENHFYIIDWFKDPLNLGIEIPGGTIYPITYGWYQDVTISGPF
jgi:RHS repeat-associated protein